jgi:LemA protein
MDSRLILERFYRVPPRKLRKTRLLHRVRAKIADFAQRYTLALVLGTMLLGLWVFSHVYYYNVLLNLRANCDTAAAQIEAAEEKRDHVRRNLTALLRFHAGYERNVLTDVTTLRGPSIRGAGPQPNETAPGTPLARIDAVGEQYPSLVVNTTVNHASQALVDAELDVHNRIVQYNNAVNMYTSYLRQFPGNMFGKMMGFHDRDYYKPQEASGLPFEEITP